MTIEVLVGINLLSQTGLLEEGRDGQSKSKKKYYYQNNNTSKKWCTLAILVPIGETKKRG